MERTNTTNNTHEASRSDRPAIFGLRYLEEEAAEVHDVVGCMLTTHAISCTGCDDSGPVYYA